MSTNNGTPDTSIRALIKSVTVDGQRLAKAQAELARTEIKSSQKEATATGGMFIGAAAAGGLGGIFLLVTIAYVLVALGLPVWAGFGIVTLVLFIVAAILGALGKKRAKSIEGLKVAKLELERTKQALSGKQPENLPVPRATDAVSQRAGDVRRATK